MRTTITFLALASLSATPALAQTAYSPADGSQVGYDAPAPLLDDRPTAPGKPAPRWMVAAAETQPAYAAPPTPRIKPLKTPKDWKPSKRWALGATLGSDGAGVDAQFLATRALVLRARAAWLNIDHGQTYDHVRYNGHVRLSSVGGFVDLHLLDGMLHPFMLSGGVVSAPWGRRHVGLNATPQGSFTFGGHAYTAAQLGAVTGDIGLDKVAPFAGAGFDNTFDTSGSIGFKLLAGVVLSGDPKVNLQSTGGLLSGTPLVQADIQQEEAKVRSAAKYLQYYPAVSTGLTYKF
jgi:hypothetical protein